MSSEDNKSKSSEINKYIKEENHSTDKNIDQILETSKIYEQNIDNSNISQNKDIYPPLKNLSSATDLNSYLNENKKINFKSKKINLFEKKENIEKICCNCTKTRCVKKYCECFASNRYCSECNCSNCLNKYIYSHINNNSKDISESEDIFCTCTKSNCNKKYCECYKSNKKCSDRCRCTNCLNNPYPIFNIKNKENNNNDNNNNEKENNTSNKIRIELDEKKYDSKSSFDDENSDDSYQIQRISIFINDYHTLVNVEKFTKEDMKLIKMLSKKRENENNK